MSQTRDTQLQPVPFRRSETYFVKTLEDQPIFISHRDSFFGTISKDDRVRYYPTMDELRKKEFFEPEEKIENKIDSPRP